MTTASHRAAQSKPTTEIAHLTCHQCGTAFTRERRVAAWEQPKKYCSVKCQGDAMSARHSTSELRVCPCGKQFMVRQYYIKVGGGKFCSTKCCGRFRSTKAPTAEQTFLAQERLPVVRLSERVRVGGRLWWADLPQTCQTEHCGGRLLVRAADTDPGEVACHLCSRAVATVQGEAW